MLGCYRHHRGATAMAKPGAMGIFGATVGAKTERGTFSGRCRCHSPEKYQFLRGHGYPCCLLNVTFYGPLCQCAAHRSYYAVRLLSPKFVL